MQQTIDYYNKFSSFYFDRTIDISLEEAYPILLREIPENGSILDLGAGSGRDSRYFIDSGYRVVAIDASEGLAKAAMTRLGVKIDVMKFSELNFVQRFDGVWASGSLLHLNDSELGATLKKVRDSLRPGGVLYASFKFGRGETCDETGRYFNFHNFSSLSEIFEKYSDLALMKVLKTPSYVAGNTTEWIHVVAKRPHESM